MSGTSRKLSFGTPFPVCQLGLGNRVLTPPPPAAMLPPFATAVAVSFQAISGMYDSAEPFRLLLKLLQKEEAFPASLNCVPPTPVTFGELAGRSTASPCVA